MASDGKRDCSIFEDFWSWINGRTEAVKSCAGAAGTDFKE